MVGTCGFCLGPYPGSVNAYGQHRCGTVIEPRTLLPERTLDGHAQVWLLYQQEPWYPDGVDEREMSLWVRRCDVFSSRERAINHLDRLIGDRVQWSRYSEVTGGWFPELWIGRRGHSRWWLTSAPLDPPGGDA